MQLLLHLFLVVVTLFTLYPVLWVVKMALTPSQAFAVGLSPIPQDASLDNFSSVVGNRSLDGTWVFGPLKWTLRNLNIVGPYIKLI